MFPTRAQSTSFPGQILMDHTVKGWPKPCKWSSFEVAFKFEIWFRAPGVMWYGNSELMIMPWCQRESKSKVTWVYIHNSSWICDNEQRSEVFHHLPFKVSWSASELALLQPVLKGPVAVRVLEGIPLSEPVINQDAVWLLCLLIALLQLVVSNWKSQHHATSILNQLYVLIKVEYGVTSQIGDDVGWVDLSLGSSLITGL